MARQARGKRIANTDFTAEPGNIAGRCVRTPGLGPRSVHHGDLSDGVTAFANFADPDPANFNCCQVCGQYIWQ